MPPRNETLDQRLRRLFRPERTGDGCLVATAGTRVRGYTQLRWGGRLVGGHRAVLAAATGGDQAGMFACHTCDVRACLEPAHLYWGTPQDNSDDRTERNGAFQTPTEKLAIARQLIDEGVSMREVARRLHIGRSTLAVHLGGRVPPSVMNALSPKHPRKIEVPS